MVTDKIIKSKCTGCHACANICPQKCISMAADNEGFLYPVINTELCINCGLCEKVCPIVNGKTAANEREVRAYAAINKNEEIRLNSSSGGIFTLIAENVLDKDGVVFGAAFDKDFDVIHTYAKTKDKLEQFRGSKYVQSVIGKTYKQAKEFLEQGRTVLFTGTPCQIGGLYSYLGKDYANLITQDLICHGVPSPMVWRKYLEYREKISRVSARRISFRRKDCGWKKFSVSCEFTNDTEYLSELTEDPYMQAFLHNLCLRPSCYDCAFKTKHRQADITLADFWGIQYIAPEMDDDKGISLLIVNSEKGEQILEEFKNNLILQKVDLSEAIKYNSAMITSVSLPKNRTKFMSDIWHQSFDKTAKKYCKVKFIVKVKNKLKSILKKFGDM